MNVFTILCIGFVSVIAIESLSIQLIDFFSHNTIVQNAIAQSLSTKTSLVNNNLEEQNKSISIEALGHFANNQIKDGIITWIQGGFWELKIKNITISNANTNNTQITNNNGIANFVANFTMIKPDGSLSHNHNINDFISKDVILTEKDIVVIGTANIYSDDKKNEYKNVPLTIHLMGNKVLGLTIDVGKTREHFASSNEMFGTLISGIGLETSNDSKETMMKHDDITINNTLEKESITMMQH